MGLDLGLAEVIWDWFCKNIAFDSTKNRQQDGALTIKRALRPILSYFSDKNYRAQYRLRGAMYKLTTPPPHIFGTALSLCCMLSRHNANQKVEN